MKTHIHIEPEDTPLRQSLKTIIVNARSERDLLNRLEEFVKEQVEASKDDTKLTMPAVRVGE